MEFMDVEYCSVNPFETRVDGVKDALNFLLAAGYKERFCIKRELVQAIESNDGSFDGSVEILADSNWSADEVMKLLETYFTYRMRRKEVYSCGKSGMTFTALKGDTEEWWLSFTVIVRIVKKPEVVKIPDVGEVRLFSARECGGMKCLRLEG